ncbi:hypothetical protein OUZ56_033282 [Daphnia magna]|uniref:Uncharacterized protein n=1 Tax=Daphnia magna TaxID=35525 RepID=A0ABR0BAI8_9CRUS|nr:hypothetical protein OUZ56_033282 [Daphnia magna]
MTENFKLSSHSNSLGVLEKARYIEKLKLVQCYCPYIIPENFWKYSPALAGFIPPTNKEEIFMHLIVKHSPLTLEQYRAFKNLEAENPKAKVTHSQSTNDPPLLPWSALSRDHGQLRLYLESGVFLGMTNRYVVLHRKD